MLKKDIICECGGWIFTIKVREDVKDEDFYLETCCMKCEKVEGYNLITNCYECNENNGRDVHEEKQNR